ncbi:MULTISPECIES: hypothetical protein [Trichocoleus]|uniref:Uncharacterized protein n=1 Tax=Trichocoleus desertorum GB2-A4 TaxID=2933944 RepID=A0ABV0J3L5_9CYAN|nr:MULTISPECIES: hypothetical protein [unclassified Trichocoleus]MBD1861714.1 hypothetical protein [Trichocoleus sp. FACHB-46]MBD2123228.1 hypothetical protein [Trichocoleus sp. FACHB-262]
MNLVEQAYQRLAIATDLVKSSVDSLSEVSDRSEVTFEVLQDLTVVLYELEKLAQDFNTLLKN